ncbi:1-aminocyclopropane-1-carboxylate oxidase homolog 1-like [Coffea eugenioides]|uniref:1-aminocyclopropane-1-carboxylate oxidase homolog 1-like n=1 Tax=Coffea eugenioides TaxID=49369 RepID=UPI000F611D04|nr:1-aminocyclopropane-1-carboxylate oxidase homolog 1-like [Coffea eugenioides]
MTTFPELDGKVKELKEFDDTKVGVRGLLDSGVAEVPRIFIRPPESHDPEANKTTGDDGSNSPLPQVPTIDLQGFDIPSRRAEIVDEISQALGTWGFFQMVNHGIPTGVLDNLLRSTREFHEQPEETRMEFYSRDPARKVKYYSTGDLYLTKVAQWKDTLSCDFDDTSKIDLESFPEICRNEIGDYLNRLNGLKNLLAELLSEALGLSRGHLASLECFDIQRLLCHYYPPCPEPDLTIGIMKHSDPYILTILLQDDIGGLQILHKNRWLDVTPVEGALLVNAGDLLQLITNDKFTSVEHRVIAKRVGPRRSVACFIYPRNKNQSKPYGPVKELLSDKNPQIYRETSFNEYVRYYASKGLDGVKALPHFHLTSADS